MSIQREVIKARAQRIAEVAVAERYNLGMLLRVTEAAELEIHKLMAAASIQACTPGDLAKVIFDWLNSEQTEEDGNPYTYNAGVMGPLLIGVDGELDCMKMAEAILRSIGGRK